MALNLIVFSGKLNVKLGSTMPPALWMMKTLQQRWLMLECWMLSFGDLQLLTDEDLEVLATGLSILTGRWVKDVTPCQLAQQAATQSIPAAAIKGVCQIICKGHDTPKCPHPDGES